MSAINPYRIKVADEKLDLLRKKLALTTFPNELDGSTWEYGAPLADIKRLVEKWQQTNWRKIEKELNEQPHFQTQIQVDGFRSLDIHFVHKVSSVKNAIPLLFVHGWPGSFIESLKFLQALAEPSDPSSPAFHIVAPSLPNFGFSQGVSERGFAIAQYAETCHKLMLKLGYKEYVTQAGDWGFWITRAIGKLYPKSCKASHLNMQWTLEPSSDVDPALAKQWEEAKADGIDEFEQNLLERRAWFQREGMGYNHLQSTKPQTIGYALNDSPVSLLAWIYEKLHDWADSYPWTDAEIIEWISIYQFSTAGPAAAGRIYYETMHTSSDEQSRNKGLTYQSLSAYTGGVKLGLVYNPKELEPVPAIWARSLGPVVYEARNSHGGHFYAHEHPEFLIRDLRTMFGRDGGAFGVVSKHNGYA